MKTKTLLAAMAIVAMAAFTQTNFPVGSSKKAIAGDGHTRAMFCSDAGKGVDGGHGLTFLMSDGPKKSDGPHRNDGPNCSDGYNFSLLCHDGGGGKSLLACGDGHTLSKTDGLKGNDGPKRTDGPRSMA